MSLLLDMLPFVRDVQCVHRVVCCAMCTVCLQFVLGELKLEVLLF
jgi:hypothetical protein